MVEVAFELGSEGYGESGQEKESRGRAFAKGREDECRLDEWGDPWEVKPAWQLWVGERSGRRADESFFSKSPATPKFIYLLLAFNALCKKKATM